MKWILPTGITAGMLILKWMGFTTIINNFIFSDRLASTNGGDSILLGKPVYKYTCEYCYYCRGFGLF